MMRTNRFLLIASLPLAIVVALGVLAMLPPGPGVTKANLDRIQQGMTLADVEELFGPEDLFGPREKYNLEHYDGVVYIDWHAYDGSTATIRFVHNRVTGKSWQDSDETIVNKFRRWLRIR
jgi:hypothetical protein